MRQVNYLKIVFILFYLTTIQGLAAQTNFERILLDSNTSGTQSLFVCDLDADGDDDILGAASEAHQIIWWENLGSDISEWEKHIIDNNLLGAGSVVADDLDGDGHLDIVGAAKGAHVITWYKNSGGSKPEFQKLFVDNNYQFPHEVFTYDINQDSKMDILAVSSTDNEVTWYKNEDRIISGWTKHKVNETFTQAKSICAEDLNNDGIPEIIATSLVKNEIAYWERDSASSSGWKKNIVDNGFVGAHRVETVDLDGDGDFDLLGTAWSIGEIAWYRNDGGSPLRWKKSSIESLFRKSCIAKSVDIDNDGDYDVIGTAQDADQVAIWVNQDISNQNIEWGKIVIDNNFDRVWPIDYGDFNNDGAIDLVAASGHRGNRQVRIYMNKTISSVENVKGNHSFKLYQNYPNPFNPETIIKYVIPNNISKNFIESINYVELVIYDLLGNEIETLVDKYQPAGNYEVRYNGKNLSSGSYFYQIRINKNVQTKKMIVIK